MADDDTNLQDTGPVIELPAEFRRAKLALLTVSAAAIIFALATIGPAFKPKLFGEDLAIKAWVVSAGFLAYIGYLLIGFEHWAARVTSRHSEAIWGHGDVANRAENSANAVASKLDRLGKTLDQIAARAEQDSKQLVEGAMTIEFEAPAVRPSRIFIGGSSLTAKLTQGLQSQSISPDEVSLRLDDFFREVDSALTLLTHEHARKLREHYQTALQKNLRIRAEGASDIVTSANSAFDQARQELARIRAEFRRLSDAFSRRERHMYRFYDLLTSRAVAGFAVCAVIWDVVEDFI